MGERSLIAWKLGREKVENGGFPGFLARFGTDRLPSGLARVRILAGVVLAIEGYGSDSQELYGILGV